MRSPDTPAPAPAPVPASARQPRRPAWERLPLLALGFAALAVGAGAGLVRLGWTLPAFVAGTAPWHGPLMICGFLGVVISLERAVALGRRWAFAAPVTAALGSAALLMGRPAWALAFFIAAGALLLAATLAVLRKQREDFVVLLGVAAGCWLAGNLAWWALGAVAPAVPWWLAFLVLTIAAERLELSRFMRPAPAARRLFRAVAVAIVAALVLGLAWPEAGARALGAGFLALAAWLLRHDIARRTVREQGLTRFIAACLLAGYVALALSGALLLANGLPAAGPARDAALHALLLGFVVAMILGHAPIVFPSVLRVALPYHPVFYAPLVLLEASVALRIAGQAAQAQDWVRWGGLGSALALAAFVVTMASAALRGQLRRRPERRQPSP